jgi:hypothetical protein
VRLDEKILEAFKELQGAIMNPSSADASEVILVSRVHHSCSSKVLAFRELLLSFGTKPKVACW